MHGDVHFVLDRPVGLALWCLKMWCAQVSSTLLMGASGAG
jgi:hypothetical protein